MQFINKKEYYKFDSNLNKKIAIDKENAKKGDVDAMVRLARYFRTGETVAFDYQSEEETLGYWYEVENDEGVTNIEQDYLSEYHPDEKNFCNGLKYAQLAADTGCANGLYEYACYLVGKACRESDLEGYFDIVSGDNDIGFYLVAESDLEKYKDLIAYTDEDGSCWRHLTEDEEAILVNEREQALKGITTPLFNTISLAFEKMLNSAENGYIPAKFMIGCYYYSGKRFNVSEWVEDWHYIYDELPECFCCGLEAAKDSTDFATAEKWFNEIIESEQIEKNEFLGRAYIMMARIYAEDNYLGKDISRALDYYLKARNSGAYINSDEIVDFYIENSSEVELRQILDLVEIDESDFSKISENIEADTLAKHIASIFEDIDTASVEKNSQNYKKFPYISVENTKLVSKLLTGNVLVNFLATRITEKPCNLGVIMDYADENDIDISFPGIEEEPEEELDLKRAVERRQRFGNDIDLCASKINSENSVFAYLKLLELANNGSEIAQIRLAETLWNENSTSIYLESTEKTVDETERKTIAKRLLEALATNGNDKAQCSLGKLLYWERNFGSDTYEQEARQWLELSASNGNVDALVVLSRLDSSKLKDAYLALKSLERIEPEINDALGMQCFESGDYVGAIQYFKEGLYEEAYYFPQYIDDEGDSCKVYFLHLFDMLLRAYEELDCTLAKAFVSNFLNEAIDKKFKCDCKSFIHNDFVPMLLDKESLYYDPAYAIRILQSREFSSPYGNYILGCLFSGENGISPNYKTASKYFKQAAEQDVGEAWYKLAYLYYFGDIGSVDLNLAKQYFEKAIFNGINCEFAYEMVRVDLKEKDTSNPMREYADRLISEIPDRKERNQRIKEHMAVEFGEYWEKLHENTRKFINSGVKTYVNNYEDDDPDDDFSTAINPMIKSLEYELGEIFYTKYKKWLQENGIADVVEYFKSIGVRIASADEPFVLGVFRYIAYERKTVSTDYATTLKLIRMHKQAAVVRKCGKQATVLRLHPHFAKYVDEIFKAKAFSKEERPQEIAAFVIDLASQVECIREELRNRADHDSVMSAEHAEMCGNILYKTKKVLYSFISKIKDEVWQK